MKQTEQTIERIKRDGQQQELVVQTLEKDANLVKQEEDEYNGKSPLFLIFLS